MREEDVLGVLSEDIVEFADIMEALRNQGFRVLHFSDDGIVIADRHSAMAALFDGGSAEAVVGKIPERMLHVIHSQELFEEFSAYRVLSEEPQLTWQEVYTGKDIDADIPEGCTIRPLTMDDYDYVHSHYRLSDGRYVASRLKAGALIGLEVNGSLVGFTGRHTEGSMGMLEVDESHRRKGYGELLERVLIRNVLQDGGIPFCHIIDGNTKSLLLQRKLGLEEAGNPVFWI